MTATTTTAPTAAPAAPATAPPTEAQPEAPLDLYGIADLLQVRYFRVRRWRDNAVHGRGTDASKRLPRPDVSDRPRNPLWSPACIRAWAAGEGLWPPGADQYRCRECQGTFSVYNEDVPIMRPHGWADRYNDGQQWPCPGSYRPPLGKAVARGATAATAAASGDETDRVADLERGRA
jgi:hypothetical protein